MRRLTLSVLSLAFLAACQPTATELTEEQKAAIANTVGQMHDEMWQPWLVADIDGGMEYYLNSPDVGWASDGEVRYGYDNLDAWWRPITGMIESQEVTIDERRVNVLARDVVCVMEYGTAGMTTTTGEAIAPTSFAMTTVWVLRDGEWKIHLGHRSTPTSESSE